MVAPATLHASTNLSQEQHAQTEGCFQLSASLPNLFGSKFQILLCRRIVLGREDNCDLLDRAKGLPMLRPTKTIPGNAWSGTPLVNLIATWWNFKCKQLTLGRLINKHRTSLCLSDLPSSVQDHYIMSNFISQSKYMKNVGDYHPQVSSVTLAKPQQRLSLRNTAGIRRSPWVQTKNRKQKSSEYLK